MFDNPNHTGRDRPLRRERFGSLTPGARPKRFWLAMVVIALLGASGVAFLLMFQV